jgi:ATP-binding cassette subfamily F protein 3
VCDEFWLVARGEVAPFDGDLDDYQRYLLDESRRRRDESQAADARPHLRVTPTPAAPSPPPPAAAVSPAEQRRQDAQRRQQQAERARPHQRALQQAEQRMQAIERERSALQERLGTAGLPRRPGRHRPPAEGPAGRAGATGRSLAGPRRRHRGAQRRAAGAISR